MLWNPDPIPIVMPIATFGIIESGRTRPIRMHCQCDDGYQEYIVKLWNNGELKAHNLAREIYGSLLANYLELQTPAIALVDIPDEFADCLPDPNTHKLVHESPGLNLGSLYIRDSKIFVPPPTPNQLSIATHIFCFDMFIGNLDRRNPKINMFDVEDDLILFDHEQAFPFSRPETFVGGPPPGWEFIKEGWSKQHILYNGLKGKPLATKIEEFHTKILSLDDNIFATIESQIPPEWQQDLANITYYLIQIRDNADLFKRSLQELLA